jgi:hypothetical protein
MAQEPSKKKAEHVSMFSTQATEHKDNVLQRIF